MSSITSKVIFVEILNRYLSVFNNKNQRYTPSLLFSLLEKMSLVSKDFNRMISSLRYPLMEITSRKEYFLLKRMFDHFKGLSFDNFDGFNLSMIDYELDYQQLESMGLDRIHGLIDKSRSPNLLRYINRLSTQKPSVMEGLNKSLKTLTLYYPTPPVPSEAMKALTHITSVPELNIHSSTAFAVKSQQIFITPSSVTVLTITRFWLDEICLMSIFTLKSLQSLSILYCQVDELSQLTMAELATNTTLKKLRIKSSNISINQHLLIPTLAFNQTLEVFDSDHSNKSKKILFSHHLFQIHSNDTIVNNTLKTLYITNVDVYNRFTLKSNIRKLYVMKNDLKPVMKYHFGQLTKLKIEPEDSPSISFINDIIVILTTTSTLVSFSLSYFNDLISVLNKTIRPKVDEFQKIFQALKENRSLRHLYLLHITVGYHDLLDFIGYSHPTIQTFEFVNGRFEDHYIPLDSLANKINRNQNLVALSLEGLKVPSMNAQFQDVLSRFMANIIGNCSNNLKHLNLNGLISHENQIPIFKQAIRNNQNNLLSLTLDKSIHSYLIEYLNSKNIKTIYTPK
ncbi:hypothetical protein DLAC_10629 [Tieghemostelium lacteum]|uniref:Uncharacterized protein n=1 Tax=Tieghemostelium lacteum TaxID=361077 RepID=A0A151Z4D7_TIELA|nr:hypothetical protein DLAC_10629 [Tieghemostelium lacteum]|eukprot:KYQ88829.1 hypothetical protein DLAC_10629 [Tieghemostelium lacteum]